MKLAIIDDHKLLLDSLGKSVSDYFEEFEVVLHNNPDTFLSSYQPKEFEIIITDIDMPKLSGVQLINQLIEKNSRQKILVISAHKNPETIQYLFDKGVLGYFLKEESPSNFITAIKLVLENKTYKSQYLINLLRSNDNKLISLTKREIEIVSEIAKGKSNKEIASDIFIAESTVKTHRKNIMYKLDLSNTAELVKFAIVNHIV